MKLLVILAAATAVLPGSSGATGSDFRLQVPHTTSAVMIDGVLSPGEWQNSKAMEVPGVAILYFQQSADFAYIAVQYQNSTSGIVDLYLSPSEGEVYNLHASAKLGERKLGANGYPDWTWWNNHGWTANVSRVDSFEKRTFLPATVREFQIRRARFPSPTWRLRLELTAMNANSEPQATTVSPPGATGKSIVDWLALDLE